MPQVVTYNLSVKVDKGPEVSSKSTLEVGSYSASVEELVCRGGTVDVEVNAKPNELEMLVITSTLYKNEKDPCPAPGQVNEKSLKFRLATNAASMLKLSGACCSPMVEAAASAPVRAGTAPPPPPEVAAGNWCPLTRPFILAGPTLGDLPAEEIRYITFKNDLGSDVKVSVLVVRPCAKAQCAC